MLPGPSWRSPFPEWPGREKNAVPDFECSGRSKQYNWIQHSLCGNVLMTQNKQHQQLFFTCCRDAPGLSQLSSNEPSQKMPKDNHSAVPMHGPGSSIWALFSTGRWSTIKHPKRGFPAISCLLFQFQVESITLLTQIQEISAPAGLAHPRHWDKQRSTPTSRLRCQLLLPLQREPRSLTTPLADTYPSILPSSLLPDSPPLLFPL